ncbi:related to MFS alpha-glucoside transporter [Cephalotrichum gorgonifer]|uniref:Related to MFS alpha-glucoside transporter n=1 Tax=Cephalotrichum gorgonifer TaxID=2041049 RepID=A0AAE8SXQ4_9PEZI|nr:related to MFS alpha-glucoside transporter [Cephalotrichum gorgonifer]
MADEINYAVVDPSLKWKILRQRWPYFLWALWTSLGSMMLGWDYVAGGQLAALPEFRKQFGVLQDDGTWLLPARYLSAWQSIGPACEIVAAIIAAPFLEKYGRKPQILVASVLSAAGVALQQVAKEWTVHLAGRAVNGAAIGMLFTISPLWIGETCRPELRGFFLCLFNTSIVLGQFLIVVIGYASSFIDGKWQWWTVVVSMYLFPAALLAVYPWFPESPYWLIREGKPDKAAWALRRIYGGADPAFLEIESRRLEEDVRLNAELHSESQHPGYSLFGVQFGQEVECFRGSNLKRTMTSMFAASAQQLIGATFAIAYATYFFELIGVGQFFLTSCMMYVVMLISTCAAFPLVEIVGRRKLIVPALFILSAILLVMGILGCFPQVKGALWGIVVMMYAWAFVYQLSIGATGFVLASEIATLRLRAATQALVTVMNGVWGLIMQFTVPYMINTDAGNLGGKTGFIFFGTGILTAVIGFFLFPETKGITFEQMDELYARGVPPRQFKKRAVDFAPGDSVEAGKEEDSFAEHRN